MNQSDRPADGRWERWGDKLVYVDGAGNHQYVAEARISFKPFAWREVDPLKVQTFYQNGELVAVRERID